MCFLIVSIAYKASLAAQSGLSACRALGMYNWTLRMAIFKIQEK